MSYQFDSDVLIDFLRERPHDRDLFNKVLVEPAFVSAMTYGELWQGVVSHPQRANRTAKLEKLLAPLKILPLDSATMRIYGEIRSHLKRTGMQISVQDILIAATAIQHSHTLITRNIAHFERIDDLKIVTPFDF